jgi:hypothetical protein
VPGALGGLRHPFEKLSNVTHARRVDARRRIVYVDVSPRVRTARSPLRFVNPAMKEGHVAKAQKAFAAFRANWPAIREFVRMQSADAYDTVEKGITDLDAALKSPQPSADRVAGLVNGMMGKINAVTFQLTTDARKQA